MTSAEVVLWGQTRNDDEDSEPRNWLFFYLDFKNIFLIIIKKRDMKYIAEDVKIKVGEHMMVVKLYLNNNNICIEFTDEDEAKMPNGYIFDGYENELIIYPYRA